LIWAMKLAADILSEESGRTVPDGYWDVSVTDVLHCPLRVWFQKRGEKVDPRYMILQDYILTLGRVAHNVLEAVLGGEHEVPVVHKFEREGVKIAVKGRADVVLRDAVIEIKTYAYSLPKSMFPKYAMQAIFYAAKLNKGKAMLLMFNRATAEVHVAYLHLFKGVRTLDKAIERFEELKRKTVEIIEDRAYRLYKVLHGERPSPEPGPWCKYCPYRNNCIIRDMGNKLALYDPKNFVVEKVLP